jgi:glycerophosphoryl diester phosphodiesterase
MVARRGVSQHGHVKGDTALVTRPRTGYAYLDVGLEQPRSVLAMAHRGGTFPPEIEGLENTLVAFQHAFDLGYRYLETDVHATRDGTLLAFHDTVLDRLTEHRGPVSGLDLAEVAEALISGREQIPTMSSLFEQFPQARFNIDIKSESAVAPLADLLASANAYDRVCVGSFSERRMRRFRSLLGREVATAATPREVATLRFFPGFPPTRRVVDALITRRVAALQVPHRRGPLRVVTPGLVAAAHARKMHVHVWTVDEPGEMHELLDRGVDGLITDRTDLLRQVLLERGQWLDET